LIIVLVVAVLVVALVGIYNSLVTWRNRVKRAGADLDAAYQKRYDTIPNLIEAVKSYKNFEKSTLAEVTKARTAAMSAGGADKGKAEDMLSGALKSLFAVAESYPDLKASENYLQLQQELVDLEDKILASRRFLNSSVMEYNTKLQTFPTNMFAGTFGFKEESSFEVSNEAVKDAPKVDFKE
jgi:LemA protein